ncbi:hypothetical protein [Rhodococcus ruber]|uniref:hypothetical protein n=1 Tax=Rhodococcus ruber TaxID=1830 RepID=UPI00191112F8|nr:hypothetical protein [Rhodococcus ruber]
MVSAVPPEEDGSVISACLNLRQGDVFELGSLPIVGPQGTMDEPAPLGVVVISQTCDVVQANRPNVLVAKVVHLDEEAARQAREGLRPRYVHVPALGDDRFADLEVTATLSKRLIPELRLLDHGVPESDQSAGRKFSTMVGRRFTRFPIPDDIVPWLTELQKFVRSKHKESDRALGRALNTATQIRIEADNWFAPNASLQLHVIVPRGAVPPFDEISDFQTSPDLRYWLDGKPSAGEIAERLFPNGADADELPPEDRHALWVEFADALARRCRLRGRDAKDPRYGNAVKSVTGQLWAEDEFTLFHINRSEELDLDHLSPPAPRLESEG